MESPLVSIVLPFRDAEHTLTECLDSITQQSFGRYELLAIDDGSTDGSAELVKSRARHDARIRYLQQTALGLVTALNRGLSESRTPLVARMDADDLMRPERLACQVDYLQRHLHIDLVASQVRLFPEEAIQAGYAEYVRWQNACLTADDIAGDIYVESPFAHPSVMFRRKVVQAIGAYRQGNFPEDYDLWLRMNLAGCRMAKLPQVLLDWRESETRLSRIDPRCSREAFDRLRAKYLSQENRLKQRPLAYWGAGRMTRRRSRLMLEKGFLPKAWIDIDPNKIGNKLNGVPVVSPQWLIGSEQLGYERKKKPFVLSYVANHGAKELIAEQLQVMGYQRGSDYLMVG